MKKRTLRTYISVIATIMFIAFWTLILLWYSPKEIVQAVGIENGYTLTFTVAMLGSLSSLTFASVYPMIVAFALGELNPLFLTIAAGTGLTLGDSLFYYLGMKVRPFLKSDWRLKLKRFADWVDARPVWMMPVIVYLWVGFTPFPNNLLTGYLAASGYSYYKVIIPVFLGNLSFPAIVTLLAGMGIEFFG
jgi:membrane protein YqaA with SNARE-associated domain